MARTNKTKKVYFCSIAWDHEVGETEVEAYSSPGQCGHIGCGIVEAEVKFVRTVRKEDLSIPGALVPAKRLKHEQLKSVRKEIATLQAWYEYLKKEKPFKKKTK